MVTKPPVVEEHKSISTLLQDWKGTTWFLAALPATATASLVVDEKWYWAIAFLLLTVVTLGCVPLIYRAMEQAAHEPSRRRTLYRASLPANVILVFLIAHFSPWLTASTMVLFVSAFLAGAHSTREGQAWKATPPTEPEHAGG